jgi:hypothetical protein
VEPERNHIRECLSAGEKFNSLLGCPDAAEGLKLMGADVPVLNRLRGLSC